MGLLKDKTKSLFGLNKDSDEIQIIDGAVQPTEGDPIEPGIRDGEERVKPESTAAREIPEDDLPPKKVKGLPGRLPRIQRFWDHLKAAGRGERTLQEYKYEFKWWTRVAQAKRKTIYTLKVEDIENILKDIHPSTARRKTAFLRGLAKFYLRSGKSRLHIETAKVISPKLPQRLPGDLGKKKFVELRDLAKKLCDQNNRNGIWLGLLIMCGLRESEIQTATVLDDEFIKVLGKGNKERKIPAPKWLLDAMEKLHKAGRLGWAKKRNLIYVAIKEIGYKPHSLRHTYASELLRRGKSLEEVQVLLGHANIATTNIYARGNVPADAARLLDEV